MAYELRHFDTPLLRFEAIDSTYAAELKITWLNEEKRNIRNRKCKESRYARCNSWRHR